MAKIDLGHINWILTANTLVGLPRPLLSRLDVVEISGPQASDFDALLAQILVGLNRRWQLVPGHMPPIHPKAEASLRQRFVQHRSARQLARDVEAAIAAVVPFLDRRTH